MLVTPRTLLRGHHAMVPRKWCQPHGRVGRPPLSPEVRELMFRHAREYPRWGHRRICGELSKRGVRVSPTSIRRMLVRAGLGPAPRRAVPSWRAFPKHAGGQHRGPRFLHGRDVCLRRYYALFFNAHGSRCVWIAGCTANPTGAWVTQQANNLALDVFDEGIRFLIRDRDSKYSGRFDEVFRSEGIRILKTPVRAPRANAIAERFVRTLRSECLDWLMILNRRHFERVLGVYVEHYNREGPHRPLRLAPPLADAQSGQPSSAEIRRRDRLGGLIHEYYRAAA